jgi:uncharacterized surface protein with fasciclin (FAS1) repeats
VNTFTAGQEAAVRKQFSGLVLTICLPLFTSSVHAADIVETAATDRSFKIFVTALETAGFAETLRNSGPYTVFAPTNDAFAKLPPGTWEKLSQDKVKLSKVLAYHVIPGKVTVSEVKPGEVKTTQGSTLKLASDNGKVTVNNEANITQSDLAADNGIIHAIDTVVLPPSEK